MVSLLKIFALGVLMILTTSCLPKSTIQKKYAVYDIANISQSEVEKIVIEAMENNLGNVVVRRAITQRQKSDKSAKFELVKADDENILSFLGPVEPVCDDASLVLNAVQKDFKPTDRRTSFFACVIPYKGGYSLNYYAQSTKKRLLNPALNVITMLGKLYDSTKPMKKVVADSKQKLELVGAKIVLREGDL